MMIKRTTGGLLLAGLALFLGSARSVTPDLPEVGTDAPAIEAASWYNSIGNTPSLQSLRGKAILLEFWATW